MTYFTPSVFSAIRSELGTLGAIQQFFLSRGIDNELALKLIFSVHNHTALRDMEHMKDDTVYFLCEELVDNYKNNQAIKEEMVVKPQS